MKVLIIEDEKLLADSIQSVLGRKGFEVECVYDGETGAEYAELGIYDLLILDVMMPKMNGCQVAREVRAKRCGTPILMLTARSELEVENHVEVYVGFLRKKLYSIGSNIRIEAVRRLGYRLEVDEEC